MNRRILAITLAVLLAVLGTAAVMIYVNNADARALEGQKAVSVLVAQKPIPAGTKANEAKAVLAAERMPAASVPSDALSSIEADVADLVTSTDLAPGELLTRRMLVEESTQSAIALPEGKLAVTIPIEAEGVAEIPLKPGFQVAVFDTFTVGGTQGGFTPATDESESGNQATRLLLPKVEVIGVVAQRAATEGDSSKSSGFGKHLVTVAVTQSEAERLIHVLKTGDVSLAQVNDESKIRPGPGIDNRHLFAKGE